MAHKKHDKEDIHVQEACDTWLSTENRKKITPKAATRKKKSDKCAGISRTFKPINTALLEFNFTQTKQVIATKQTNIKAFFKGNTSTSGSDSDLFKSVESDDADLHKFISLGTQENKTSCPGQNGTHSPMHGEERLSGVLVETSRNIGYFACDSSNEIDNVKTINNKDSRTPGNSDIENVGDTIYRDWEPKQKVCLDHEILYCDGSNLIQDKDGIGVWNQNIETVLTDSISRTDDSSCDIIELGSQESDVIWNNRINKDLNGTDTSKESVIELATQKSTDTKVDVFSSDSTDLSLSLNSNIIPDKEEVFKKYRDIIGEDGIVDSEMNSMFNWVESSRLKRKKNDVYRKPTTLGSKTGVSKSKCLTDSIFTLSDSCDYNDANCTLKSINQRNNQNIKEVGSEYEKCNSTNVVKSNKNLKRKHSAECLQVEGEKGYWTMGKKKLKNSSIQLVGDSVFTLTD